MNYKKLFIFTFLILICLPIFAGGVGESMASGLVKGAGMGFSVGGIAGGIGAIPGALIGAGIGAIGGGISGAIKEDSENQVKGESYRDKYLVAKQAENEYDSQIETYEAGITDATNKISTYDEFISEYIDYKSQQLDNLQSEGDSQFSQLMENFSSLQTIYGATGNSGASAAIATEIGKQSVEKLAGSDLTMNTTGGGTFAKVWENTETELDDKYSSSLLSKQDLYSTIENYRASIKTNTESMNTQKKLSSEYKDEAEKYGVKVN